MVLFFNIVYLFLKDMVVVKNSGAAQEVICLEITHKDKNQDVILTFSGACTVLMVGGVCFFLPV